MSDIYDILVPRSRELAVEVAFCREAYEEYADQKLVGLNVERTEKLVEDTLVLMRKFYSGASDAQEKQEYLNHIDRLMDIKRHFITFTQVKLYGMTNQATFGDAAFAMAMVQYLYILASDVETRTQDDLVGRAQEDWSELYELMYKAAIKNSSKPKKKNVIRNRN